MTTDIHSTRRSFLKTGALLAAPLGAAASAAEIAHDGLKARLARLEDEAAIRELHQTWLRRVNTDTARGEAGDAPTTLFARPEAGESAQTVRSIVADHSGEADAIEVAADGTTAAGRFRCSAEIVTAIAQDCTLAEMAHAQGGGFVRRTERGVLKVAFRKSGGVWAIARVELAPV